MINSSYDSFLIAISNIFLVDMYNVQYVRHLICFMLFLSGGRPRLRV